MMSAALTTFIELASFIGGVILVAVIALYLSDDRHG
jgi:hypothetical protein